MPSVITSRNQTGAGQVNPGSSYTDTVVSVQEMTIQIPDGAVDQQVNMDIKVARIVTFGMSSDETLEVEFNSGATPTDTISFVKGAKQEEVWRTGEPNPPLTVDVTAIFFSNASGNPANVRLKVGQSA